MGYEIVGKVIGDFLTRSEPDVLSLKGVWGAGKTYAWKKIFNDFPKEECHLPSYSYVSLFGISSLQELKLAIVMNAIAIKDDKEIHKFIEKSYKKGAKLIDIVKGAIPIIKDISFSAESFLPNMIKDIIVCFDDFERLTTDGSIQPEEVLGFISELKEEKNCKVILIFNEEKLGKNLKNIYDKYREKVIDKEIQFSPTVEEAVKIVFSDQSPYYKQVMECCSKLNITNIRVIKKISEFINIIDVFAKDLHPDVMMRAIQTLVLVTASYYKSSNDLPDMDFLQNYKSMSFNLLTSEKNKDQDDEETKKYRQWRSIVNSYQGYYIFTDLSYVIMDLVKRGYLDEAEFSEQAKTLHKNLNMDGLKQSFEDVWKIYYGSFENNEDEFIDESSSRFKQCIKALDINDLNSLISVYNQLGRETLANELIDFFAKEKITESNAIDFIGNGVTFYRHPVVANALKKYADSYLPKLTLIDALRNVGKHRAWSHNEADILLAATENDYYNLFKTYHGEDLNYIVGACVDFPLPNEKYNTIIINSRAALKRIAEENCFNKIRILNIYKFDFK